MADEPQRHRIEVACPECGHTQIEPALVISTQCRSCRIHFQVRDGVGVPRPRPMTRLAPQRQPGDPTPTAQVSKPAPAPPRLKPGPAKPRSLLRRLLHPTRPPREVLCFGCGHRFHTAADAQSSQCPKCSGYVSLLDYDIAEHWNRRIQTRGNVLIRKTGKVVGVTVRCHQLTVLGELAGSVECSGDLIIRSHGKIVGTVQCRTLRVEKGARVEFLNPVHAESAVIDGHVRGQITCAGAVTLQKRAHLHGLVRTSSLIVKPGAKHTGTIEMVTQAQS